MSWRNNNNNNNNNKKNGYSINIASDEEGGTPEYSGVHPQVEMNGDDVVVVIEDDRPPGSKLTDSDKEDLKAQIQAALNVADEIADVVTEVGGDENEVNSISDSVEHVVHNEGDTDNSETARQAVDILAAYEEAIGDGDTIQVPERWKDRSTRRKRGRSRRGRRRSVISIEEVPTPPALPTISEEEASTKRSPQPPATPGPGDDGVRVRAASPVPSAIEEDLNCIVAHTSLIIPFIFGNHRMPPGYWEERLSNRTILTPSGESIKLWQTQEALPMEVAELSRQFRQMLGWKEKRITRSIMNTWRCRRLRLTPQAQSILFHGPKLWAVQREDGEERDVHRDVSILNIDLVLFPMGIGILVFHIDWLAPHSGSSEHTDDDGHSASESERSFHHHKPSLSLEELRTWLYVAKFRHGIPHVAKGWTFENSSGVAPCVAHTDSIGKRMQRAIYENRPVSLNAIGNWLLLFEGENPSSPPARVGYGGHAYHQSIVVLDRKPTDATLREYLFHLRHAYGQKNRPPPTATAVGSAEGDEVHSGLDKVLVPRLNRYIGISREGIICMTWSTEYAGTSFDVSSWHRKFQGIYLILSLHAHGERAVLEELGSLAASYADSMQLEVDKATMQEIETSRRQMKELATLVARFTISMSSDDCGGLSEYSEFFTAMRQTFGIPHQRAELREELQDTFSLLESNYLEERRRLKLEEQKEERMEKERIKTQRMQKEADKHRYETIISSISSVTIPAVLVASVFGMNLPDLPQPSFWPLLAIVAAVSAVVLILQLGYLRKMEKHHHH